MAFDGQTLCVVQGSRSDGNATAIEFPPEQATAAAIAKSTLCDVRRFVPGKRAFGTLYRGVRFQSVGRCKKMSGDLSALPAVASGDLLKRTFDAVSNSGAKASTGFSFSRHLYTPDKRMLRRSVDHRSIAESR